MPDASTVRAYATRNTLRALEELAAGPCSAPELAARLAIGERAARKLLQRCALEGWATQGDWHHRRYAPTLRLAAVARRALDASTLLHFAGPQLQDLAAWGRRRSSLWIRDADCALEVMHCLPGATPKITLGPPIPGDALAGAASIHDDRGTLVAAIALTPATPSDAPAVTAAARIITELIRDGVL